MGGTIGQQFIEKKSLIKYYETVAIDVHQIHATYSSEKQIC